LRRVAGINREQIVEAALELLDEQGLTGVTTRKIAARLGVKSASLYWHLRSRDELLDLLADRIVADAHWPESAQPWRTVVEELMREYLRCLLAHRDAARVAAGRPPSGPYRLRGAETMLSALIAGGLGEQSAVDAALVLTTYVVGFALEHDAAAARPNDAASASLQSSLSDQYPTLGRLAALTEPADRFEQGLALILDGIESGLAGQD
jgi:AcrR family transcriptional regulator